MYLLTVAVGDSYVTPIVYYFYRPQTKLREGNGFTPVCDSVHSGGGLCLCSGGLCPGGLCQGDPHPLYSKERAVRILLECFLVLITMDSLKIYRNKNLVL